MAAHVDQGDISPSPAGNTRPRTPASASAVRDGRNLLAAFRNNKRERRDGDGGSSPAVAAAVFPTKSNGNSADRSSVGKTIDYIERYKFRAPGLARNLEAALDASLATRVSTSMPNTIAIASSTNTDSTDNDDDGGLLGSGDNDGKGKGGGGETSCNAPNDGAAGSSKGEGSIADGGENSCSDCDGGGSSRGDGGGGGGGGEASPDGPNGEAVRRPGGEVCDADGAGGEKSVGDGGSGESSDGAASVATAASAAAAAASAAAAAVAAAADVATAVTKPSPPRHTANGDGSGSPAGPTPEVRSLMLTLPCRGVVVAEFDSFSLDSVNLLR